MLSVGQICFFAFTGYYMYIETSWPRSPVITQSFSSRYLEMEDCLASSSIITCTETLWELSQSSVEVG